MDPRSLYEPYRNKNEHAVNSGGSGKRDHVRRNSENKDKFDRKKPIICFHCNRAGRIRPVCPDLKRKGSGDVVNYLGVDVSLGECFTPYFKRAEINGIERNYLWDAGAGIELCDHSWNDNENLIGEVTWIKQPLDNECRCLPLARVTIKADFGTVVITKAAVKSIELEQGYYLLGNKTAELIEESKSNPVPVNAVTMRNQSRKHKKERYEV